jgi:hypothetical protein
MKKFITLILCSSFLLTSCMTTSTTVGSYQEDDGKKYTYAKGKQLWLGFGLIPIGRVDVSTPVDGNCEVISKFTFGDFLISGLTGGIISSRTIIVKDKK